MPGTNKAVLTLAGGSIVSLDSAVNIRLKEADGTLINKQTGKLVYSENNSDNAKIFFNVLSTPRGGDYQLVLADGTKVWLNAASSLKFPTRFEGKERTVYLHGEAYFEVAKNKQMPFHVVLDNDMTVEVLGTHFNIMGYSDEEEIKTTLIEGTVKVTTTAKTVLLTPSTQAVISKADKTMEVGNTDVVKELAWKNGTIEFDGDDLQYMMRQIGRWYDVDIQFSL